MVGMAIAWLTVPDLCMADRRPNVVLLMADDMGYEALGCNGGTSYETPILDRIASDGMRFTNCYSQPVCTPSRVKIMTGRFNARNYTAFGVLIPAERTFGNIMKEAGYQTAIAGKWQLSGGGPGAPTHGAGTWMDKCGFGESCMWAYEHYLSPQDFEHYRKNASPNHKKGTSRFWNPGIIQNGKYRPTSADDYGPDIYSEFLLDFITRHQNEEFFVYYPMALTHGPFVPTPNTKGLSGDMKFKSDTRHFGDMVRYCGTILDRILTRLVELQIAEDTLVLFTCDNGTGREIVSWMGDRVVLGGKAMPIDAGCHVPMIAYWKGTIPPGSVCHDLIDFSDFLPTIADIGNATVPDDRVIDGRSFLPQLKGKQGDPRDTVLVHYDKDPGSANPKFRRVRFAYDGTYKLYLDGNMYKVHEDWDEQRPLSMATASRTREQLQRALDVMPAWEPNNTSFQGRPDPTTLQRLEKSRRIQTTK
jgi:arylsulfatase A-like enzyme